MPAPLSNPIDPMTQRRWLEVLEVAVLFALQLFVFWYLLDLEYSSRSIVLGFGVLGLFFLFSFIRHWPGLKALGFFPASWKPVLKWVLIPCVIILTASIWVGRSASEVVAWPEADDCVSFFLWGLVQQAILQGYFTRRFYSITQGHHQLTALLSAATFALWHLPNERLMLVTFMGGYYLTVLYLRHSNLWACALIHAFISLSLVSVFKPTGFIPSYNAGPQPVSPIRRAIRAYRGPDDVIGEYVPSQIPESFSREFMYDDWKVQTPVDLEKFLYQEKPYLFVLSERDLELFETIHKDKQLYRLRVSYVWRRKFPKMWQQIGSSLRQGDLARLERLFRDRVVLVSNRPRNS